MFFKEFLNRQNRIHLKIIVTFLCFVLFFAIAQTLWTTRRMSRDFEAHTTNRLHGYTRLLNEVIKEHEDKVSFYAQFMADVTKLSDELTDTGVGRSVLIYLLDSLKKDRVRIRLYRGFTTDQERRRLVRKGLLGIRTTTLVEEHTHGKSVLNIAAVAPIERAGDIREVIIAEYPLDHEFLRAVEKKTGADFTLIYKGRLFSSTITAPLYNESLFDLLDETLQREIVSGRGTVIRDVPDPSNPRKIVFNPLSVNFKNLGIYAVSESLRQVLLNKRRIVFQNILITAIILIGVVLLYNLILSRITQPIMDLSSASKQVAEGNLDVRVAVKTKDEIGRLGESFNVMVNQLRQSQDEAKKRMDELSRLYQKVTDERNISKSILDNLSSGVILFDSDQRVVLINPTAQQWLGIKEGQIKGRQIVGKPKDPSLEPLYMLAMIQPIENLIQCWKHFDYDKGGCPAFRSDDPHCWLTSGTFHRDEIAAKHTEKSKECAECDVYQRFRTSLSAKREVKFEEVELTKPQHRVLKVAVSPVFDEHEKFLGRINVFSDVTSEREIDRLKTEFVSLVSHELRTPLSSIKAYAEILLKRPDRDRGQQVEFLSIINDETDRLTRLINDILNITKIEERGVDLEKKPLNMPQIIDKSISAFRSYAQKKNIEIEMKVENRIPKAWADEDTLLQVLANLLNNAIKYTPQSGEIQISAARLRVDSRASKEIEVKVKDNGIGIPTQHLDRIFDRFYRIARPQGGDETGTGLGLYFCKYIVERHGGRIRAESIEGEGTTFAFTLPIAKKSRIRIKPISDVHPANQRPYRGELREKASFLVVDDEKRIRDFLRYYLQEAGFTVYEAENGIQALELARTMNPTAILLDAVMPGMDGYAVLKALKEDEKTKDISVIVLSGAEDSKVAMGLGAADYLVKPVDGETLNRAIRDILAKATDSINLDEANVEA
ncbi:MAG: response regulator [Proteobacteria bacterium]|nr:response regulator [Pseudomonadota bacterium]NIS70010.1 response regulator [Pseudomonadota bacterium]